MRKYISEIRSEFNVKLQNLENPSINDKRKLKRKYTKIRNTPLARRLRQLGIGV